MSFTDRFARVREKWSLGRGPAEYRGKTVVITGASRGLGLLLARDFARCGARLALLSRNERDIAGVANDAGLRGADVLPIRCDVRSRKDLTRTIARIRERFGRIDVLVNNAGVIQVGPFAQMTERDFAEAMGTYFWGPLRLIRAVAPLMRDQGGGHIINISSVGGRVAVPHMAPYVAGKFALAGLTDVLHAELSVDGIKVTGVYPLTMRTGSPFNVVVKGQTDKEFGWFLLGDSLPLLSMDAERAAHMIVRRSARGKAHVVPGFQARIAEVGDAAFPNTVSAFRRLVARALPAAPSEQRRTSGWNSGSPLLRSRLARLSQRAAERNREVDSHVRRESKRVH